jgi:hypothetical protein
MHAVPELRITEVRDLVLVDCAIVAVEVRGVESAESLGVADMRRRSQQQSIDDTEHHGR